MTVGRTRNWQAALGSQFIRIRVKRCFPYNSSLCSMYPQIAASRTSGVQTCHFKPCFPTYSIAHSGMVTKGQVAQRLTYTSPGQTN